MVIPAHLIPIESEPSMARKRGRPRQPENVGKRHPLGFRTTAELSGKLQIAASKSGRSMAQELEARLERSFLIEDIETVFGNVFDMAMRRMAKASAAES